MSENTTDSPSLKQQEVKDILQRLYFMRRRFKAVLPENLAAFKERIRDPKLEGISRYDLLYGVGVVFARQDEPVTMGDLSRGLDIPLSNATRIVDWMVQNGYVQRLADPEDRRVVRIALTEAGGEVYRALSDLFAERASRLLNNFTAEEQGEWIYLLRKLVTILEETS